MTDIRGLLKIGALASLLSAVTTATLIYGPSPEPVEGLQAQAELADNWLYLYKPWILFFHPQFAFLASLAAAAALWRKRPALVSIALFYLLIWAITEMTQQAYVIDALNQYWRPAYMAAETGAQKQAYETLLTGFGAISDSLYFVLLFGFGVGTACLGAGFLSSDGLGKAIGGILIAIGLLSLTAFTGYYFGPAGDVTGITGWLYANLYGPVQTGVRIALAWWLWRESVKFAPGAP